MNEAQQPPNGPILVAVDFSEDSRLALIWAARQAQLEAAPLAVLHVVHDPAASPGFYHRQNEDWLRPMFEVAEDMLTAFIAQENAKHPDLSTLAAPTLRLVSGLPASRTVEVAQEMGARLVVIGSRGSTGLEVILLGSVAERVAQLCPVPVVIVKAPEKVAAG